MSHPADDVLTHLIEPAHLESIVTRRDLLVIDLSAHEIHNQYHVPGSIHLDYSELVVNKKPVSGLLPSLQFLQSLFSGLGIHADTHVVAYDDEGGGKAGRLLWTLDVVGHKKWSLLNGGLHGWINEGHPVSSALTQVKNSHFSPTYQPDVVADSSYILEKLKSADAVLVDVRSLGEYLGQKVYAARGGHIPGAQHFEWTRFMDKERNLRLRSREVLIAELTRMHVTQDREVIVYCQSHHRSSHTYVALRVLGYQRVRGYHGAWSEWGNRPGLPIQL